MSHERLAALIAAQHAARLSQPETRTTHEQIARIFQALDQGDITEGQARRLLGHQAVRLPDAPAHAALSRQAAADLRQMQRENREGAPADNAGSQGRV